MPRRNVYLDDETDAWLRSRPGGRSATIRELVQERRKRGDAPAAAGLSPADRAALVEQIRAEVLAGLHLTSPAGVATQSVGVSTRQEVPQDEEAKLREKATKTAGRFF